MVEEVMVLALANPAEQNRKPVTKINTINFFIFSLLFLINVYF